MPCERSTSGPMAQAWHKEERRPFETTKAPISRSLFGVPRAGFEPAHLSAPPPQDGVSTNSTTWALTSLPTQTRNVQANLLYGFGVGVPPPASAVGLASPAAEPSVVS